MWLVIGWVLWALPSVAGDAAASPVLLEEVARDGQPLVWDAAGAGEIVEAVSGDSLLGDGGDVALVCTTRRAGQASAQSSLWSGTPGTMTRIARVRETAPALEDGPVLESFHLIGIDAAGRALFDGKTRGRASRLRTSVIWYGRGEFAGRVARSGERMLGGDDDAAADCVRAVALTPGGVLLVSASYMSEPDAVRTMYYVGRPDGLSPVPRPAAPSVPAASTAPSAGSPDAFGSPLGSLNVNDRGQVLLMTSPSDRADPYPQSLWLARSHGLVPVAASNEPAAGMPAIARYGHFLESVAARGLNDRGDVAFAASISPETREGRRDVNSAEAGESRGLGIWTGRPGKLSLVAKAGAPMPGCANGEMLRWTRDAVLSIDSIGTVLLGAEVSAAGEAATSACWMYADGELSLLAREGVPIAGVAGLATGVLATPAGELRPRLSREGRFLQGVQLSGSDVADDNRFGIALFERGKGWLMILRYGDVVDVKGTPSSGAIRSIEWVGGVNKLGQFLVIGEVEGRPGRAMYRVSAPTDLAAARASRAPSSPLAPIARRGRR